MLNNNFCLLCVTRTTVLKRNSKSDTNVYTLFLLVLFFLQSALYLSVLNILFIFCKQNSTKHAWASETV